MSDKPLSVRPRMLNAPRPVTVDTADGAPVAVAVGGVEHTVVEIIEQWRLDEGWWRPKPISRHYWRVQLDDGQLVVVFQDQVAGSWWTQRA